MAHRVIMDYAQMALLQGVTELPCDHCLRAFAEYRRRHHDFPLALMAAGSLHGFGGNDEVGLDLDPYFPRPAFEPPERIGDFDRNGSAASLSPDHKTF